MTFKSSTGDLVTLITVNRSPSSCDMNYVENEKELNKLVTSFKTNSILSGDFNFSGLDWESFNTTDKQSEDFLEACNSSFLKQYVDFSTHIAGKTLDLLLSNNDDFVGSVTDEGRLGTCDHNMTLTEILLPGIQSESTELIPDYTKADFDKLKQFLAEITWEE